MAAEPANVIYMSTILGRDGPITVHKCDWKCQNEHVFGNMYRCKLTGITHICDKNCDQRILYDNHSSLCRASRQVFPLTQAEEQAVRGVRRKLNADISLPSDSCGFKRRRDAQFHLSPFERSFSAVSENFHSLCWMAKPNVKASFYACILSGTYRRLQGRPAGDKLELFLLCKGIPMCLPG
ncbi:Detected protein of unknown function [Hibiscus syriacus]|uniref:Uncharacterized protein n=1 Tax=Hibiscus syriacus TaxID=106335 RepID=A0A6A3CIR5_HIBSY|nr:Detected protein of unknown function [Hibiscus syriacus]